MIIIAPNPNTISVLLRMYVVQVGTNFIISGLNFLSWWEAKLAPLFLVTGFQSILAANGSLNIRGSIFGCIPVHFTETAGLNLNMYEPPYSPLLRVTVRFCLFFTYTRNIPVKGFHSNNIDYAGLIPYTLNYTLDSCEILPVNRPEKHRMRSTY